MKFLVIGCGSIGHRHISNLTSLGFDNIQVFDSNKDLLKKIGKSLDVKILESLDFTNVDITFICTPPNSHISLAKKALMHKSHVFIEKPLSNSIEGINEIKKLSKKYCRKIFVGYVFRMDLGIQKVKKILEKKTIGKIISFDAYEGWYLPNWRPWQDHKKSYTGSKNLGGGIIFDGSHEVNYLQWFGGEIKQTFSYYRDIPHLKVKSEGLAEVLLQFKSKAIGRIHLDFINPEYNRHCEVIGEKGSIKWDFAKKTVIVRKHNSKKISKFQYSKDTNKMYLNEIKQVIKCLKGKGENFLNIDDAIKTLEISIAIKKSGNENRPISI
jgi:predicted dehydrogenase